MRGWRCVEECLLCIRSYLTSSLFAWGPRARLGFDGFFERMEKSGRSVLFCFFEALRPPFCVTGLRAGGWGGLRIGVL